MSTFDPVTMECVADAIRRPIRWIMSVPGWFTTHPTEKGVTYDAHLYRTWYMAWRLGYGSLCLLIHGVFPFYCKTAGSRTIKEMYLEIKSEEEKVKEEGSEKQV